MNLGVQYYRPPFPNDRYWAEDFARIRDSGLNTVQFWVLWAWVESRPGKFNFDDYDRLMDLADKNGLGVILSTIAEIQPYWIHREVPDSEMIDHMGRIVVSSNRCECHFGLTPGGCTDVPGVWDRMRQFLSQTVKRYRNAPNLRGWDAWNELRWNVQADGLVCYCEDTLREFRAWLKKRYGSLEELNRAWLRRYGSFEEVLPGKLPDRPYTEMMAFEHFLTVRANRHGKARYDLMKSLDPNHTITVHGADPCVFSSGWREDHPLNRGNDWFYADDLDGVGCSSFPKWAGIDDADFGTRVECVKSAARDKKVWLSEVQGGRSAVGFDVYESVDPASQQRWIWNGLACGADTILFWCWRDEVFGRESAGFGLAGDDGLADQRLAAMKVTGRLIEENQELFARYRPVAPKVGILFGPQSYYLTWAQEGNGDRAANAIKGYARALVRKSIPYKIIEEEHLDALAGVDILFMPRTIVTDEPTEKALADFVAAGGTIVCESECGAFNSQGLYRYPADRFTARLTGAREIGRRTLVGEQVEVQLDETRFTLDAVQWLTPWQRGGGTESPSVLMEVPVGKGKVILCGAYLGDAYFRKRSPDFELFLETLVRRTGWKSPVEVISPLPDAETFVYIKYGESAGRRIVFVFFPPGHDTVKLNFAPGFFGGPHVRDLITGQDVSIPNCTLRAPDWRLAVLVETGP